MKRRLEVLLAILTRFEEQGRGEMGGEISLSEVLEGIQEIQKSVDIGYYFSKDIVYSRNLLRDITQLRRRGYLDEYRYMHDSFLPKSFIRLKGLGKAEGRNVLATLAADLREHLNRGITVARDQASQRWRIFSRAARVGLIHSPSPMRPIPSQSFLPAGHRARELAWRRTHQQVLREYAGQWMVLDGEAIMAHGPDLATVVAEARTKGIAVPYVFYVEAQEKAKTTLGL